MKAASEESANTSPTSRAVRIQSASSLPLTASSKIETNEQWLKARNVKTNVTIEIFVHAAELASLLLWASALRPVCTVSAGEGTPDSNATALFCCLSPPAG